MVSVYCRSLGLVRELRVVCGIYEKENNNDKWPNNNWFK